jgi:NitT/TauT family transport system substrate-binding protein
MQGWEWARQNPDAAAQIVLDNDASGAQTIAHQRRMMGEIARLLDTQGGGRLDPADYERTVQTLLSSGGDSPVITRAPTGAWTHAVVDAAR